MIERLLYLLLGMALATAAITITYATWTGVRTLLVRRYQRRRKGWVA